MERPADPNFIAYAGTPNELWWDGSNWIKPPVQEAPAVSMDQLTRAYSAIRDARASRKRLWEEKDKELEDDMRTLRTHMLAFLNKTGAKSIATDAGTVYRSEKVKAAAADWSAVYAWIMDDPDRFEMLEKRLKPTFVSQYMEEHDGAVPPGVNVHREYEVSVRRPNSK